MAQEIIQTQRTRGHGEFPGPILLKFGQIQHFFQFLSPLRTAFLKDETLPTFILFRHLRLVAVGFQYAAGLFLDERDGEF